MASKTPILDKYRLHPFGGYCTCFSNPYATCQICKASNEQAERWKTLSASELKKAEAEMDYEYPRTSNQDGR